MNKKPLDSNPVFIFAVCGRSSSTALQRILNSSNEICIWGEQRHIIDKLMEIIHHVDCLMEEEIVYRDIRFFIHSVRKNYHFYPYANATGNLIAFRNTLIEALRKHLMSPASGIKRFGFKCIGLKNKLTLQVLAEIFPNCQFIFLFRNPIDQWPSVHHYKWWDYAHNLQTFLGEYHRIATIMLKYMKFNPKCIILENSRIQSYRIFDKVLDEINIGQVDPEVVEKKITFEKINFPDDEYSEIIKEHAAYLDYQALRALHI